jgi:hypothetical protein
VASFDSYTVDLYDFDNTTGQLSNRRTINGIYRNTYGVEFSPDGNQLYATGYYDTQPETDVNDPKLYQYNISTGTPVQVTGSPVRYWTQTGFGDKGGGLKLGPDGKIYVTQYHTNRVGVISNPNATTDLSLRYDDDELILGVTYDGLQFSTGLTKPAIMACNMNTPPTTQPDTTTLCASFTSRTATVNVLLNDSDEDDNTVYLTGAHFANTADMELATLTVNAADSTVTLTVKPTAVISNTGHVFDIVYDVKDNGLPASQCAVGLLRIKVYPPALLNYPDLRVWTCPGTPGSTVNLSKYLDTVELTQKVVWDNASGSPDIDADGIIATDKLVAPNTYTYTYTVTNICISDIKRKIYLKTLNSDRLKLPKDTIAICYINAEAVNINQIFGIDADGEITWSPSPAIDAYIAKSAAYGGAVIMNGKEIYEHNAGTAYTWHGTQTQKVEFIYTPDINSCLAVKEYKIVIILTPDMTR